MGTPRISIGAGRQESLQELVNRYRILSEPATIKKGLTYFTLHQDFKLYNMLISDGRHPKDTGLLKKSWLLPAIPRMNDEGETTDVNQFRGTPYFGKYKPSFQSGKFNVYLLNSATVGKQASLKYQQMGWGHRKKKLIRRHNLKRYLPFVDARTGFYSKKLRVIRQGLDKDWKRFVKSYLWDEFKVMV